MRRVLKNMTRTDWAFVHFKASIGLLWLIPLLQYSNLRQGIVTDFLWVLCGITFLGFWVSVVGIVMSAQRYRVRRIGFVVEMTGIWLLASGPLVYMAMQVGVWIDTGRSTLLAITFGYVMLAAIIARGVMIKGAAKSRTVIYRYTEEAPGDD